MSPAHRAGATPHRRIVELTNSGRPKKIWKEIQVQSGLSDAIIFQAPNGVRALIKLGNQRILIYRENSKTAACFLGGPPDRCWRDGKSCLPHRHGSLVGGVYRRTEPPFRAENAKLCARLSAEIIVNLWLVTPLRKNAKHVEKGVSHRAECRIPSPATSYASHNTNGVIVRWR